MTPADDTARSAFNIPGWYFSSIAIVLAMLIAQAHAQVCERDDLYSGDLSMAMQCIQRSDATACGQEVIATMRSVGISPDDVNSLTEGWWVSAFSCRDGQRRAVLRISTGWFGSRYVVYPEKIPTTDWQKLPFFRPAP